MVHFGTMKVYWLAKDLQFLDPASFGNIFLGIEGFDTEKVMVTCSGKYLEDTEIDSILVENQVYGPENVKHFMNGGHYVRGIRGMAIISEVLYGPLLDQFLIEIDENTQNQVVQKVTGISQLINKTNNQSTNTEWEKLTTKMKSLGFDVFNENRKKKSEQFLFWHNFISKVFPVLRDLTRSHREGDWKLYFLVIQRALPLVFAFDRTNCKRWLPLYFEDSLSLLKNLYTNLYTSIHESFLQGELIVRLTQRNVSTILMDQGLESKYNKPVKGGCGINGMMMMNLFLWNG